ncbi:helix-turn-helix transcriptional regulator [Streptomyces sp. NPDC047917]|uniref:helix-turn-helix transcriptional regulator n=1 Tax=Streptomyces sp. NPDC047917 TaxID=3365491 RepID=UPI003722DBC4
MKSPVAPKSTHRPDPRATLRDGLPDRYLTPEDIATLLSIPLDTVYAWRKKRTGPPGFRVGRHLRYDPAAVHAWVIKQGELDAA